MSAEWWREYLNWPEPLPIPTKTVRGVCPLQPFMAADLLRPDIPRRFEEGWLIVTMPAGPHAGEEVALAYAPFPEEEK